MIDPVKATLEAAVLDAAEEVVESAWRGESGHPSRPSVTALFKAMFRLWDWDTETVLRPQWQKQIEQLRLDGKR